MFNNSGRKIKGWAKALFVILLIIGLFMILVYHNQFKSMMEYNQDLNITSTAFRVGEIVVFGFGFIIYAILMYVSCLLIYGYGELIENTKTINSDMAEQKDSVNQIKGDIRAIYLRLRNDGSPADSKNE